MKKKLNLTKAGALKEDVSDQTQIVLKKSLEWKNLFVGINKTDHKLQKNLNDFQRISETILSIEEKFSEYLFQHDKEWEIFSNREDFVK